jgi:hypothetical protein
MRIRSTLSFELMTVITLCEESFFFVYVLWDRTRKLSINIVYYPLYHQGNPSIVVFVL